MKGIIMTKDAKRIKAENRIIEAMNAFDPSGHNSRMYKTAFKDMSNAEFGKFMRRLYNEEEYLVFEIDTLGEDVDLNLEKIFKICRKLNFKTHQSIIYRENAASNGAMSVSPDDALVVYVPVKRLQQMLSKKNNSSSNTDKINPITGTVTSDSKSASLNDTQLLGLMTVGAKNVIKELMGPRADDSKSKMQMIQAIEDTGSVSLNDLHIKPENKQSLETARTLLKAVGVEVKLR